MRRSIGITLRQRRHWMERLEASRKLGYDAAKAGQPQSANPYRQSTLRLAWRCGYIDAQHGVAESDSTVSPRPSNQ